MKNKIKCFVSFLILFLAFFFLFSSFWVPDNFGEISFAQIIFHIKVPLEGANSSLVYDFIIKCVVFPIFIALVLLFLLHKNKKNYIQYTITSKKTGKEYYFSILKSMGKHSIIVSLILCISFFHLCAEKLGFYGYIENLSIQSKIYEKYYVDASQVSYQFPQEKRNLIYIFLESMETSYYSTDLGGTQENNLIPELYELAQQNQVFDGDLNENRGFYVPEGTGWTAGAMVAQSTGLPLRIPIDGNGYNSEYFLPGAFAIGEILNKAGYNQELLLGSEAEFGGRKYFYTKHGNYHIEDYLSAKENGWIPKDYYQWWGYEDEKLYEFAKEEVTALANENEPFNFTMLTADSHFPDGYRCPQCPDSYDSQYANVLACSSTQVYNFVQWVQEQDFADNTTIVICGDHTSMDQGFFQDVDDNYERKGYYVFINSAIQKDSQGRKVTTFDLFPTTLASMGITFNSNRLGLGTNLYTDERTMLELYGFDKLQEELRKNSKFYDNNILYGD